MKNTLLYLMMFGALNVALSQTGPGGVGSIDGTSDLILWLDADAVTGTNGTTITSWNDQSGYNHHFTVGNGAIFNTSIVNGYSAFHFNSTSHYFERAYSASINPASFSIFTTSNVETSSRHKALVSSRDDISPNTRGYTLYSIPSPDNWEFWTGGSGVWDILSGTSSAGSWAGQQIHYSSSNKEVFVNDAYVSGTHTMVSNSTKPYRVGAGANEGVAKFFFKGDIGEVIKYKVKVNDAQRIIISNYLSAKYDYTIGGDEIYTQDNNVNGDYDHEVAGIGRVDASNIHSDAQGTGIVRILNPTGLGDNEFLMWGHDNGIEHAIDIADVPTGVQARFDRVWRVSEVNSSGTAVDVGNVDIRWDLSNFSPITTSDLRLLVDIDNDGDFSDETIATGGVISGASIVSGSIYQFSGVTRIANNLRFTIGTVNSLQTPLPIELINFDVSPLNKKRVQLNWQTVSERNNDFFTVERSPDAVNWESLNNVLGAGSSSMLLSYSLVDNSPYLGISYYRLKQTDFDGDFSYSNSKSVQFDDFENEFIQIYPNPTNDFVIVIGNEFELKSVTIYNLLGENITESVTFKEGGNKKLVLDLSKLNSGVFFIKTKTTINKIYKQ